MCVGVGLVESVMFQKPQRFCGFCERTGAGQKADGSNPRKALPKGAELHKRRSRAEASRVEPAASPLHSRQKPRHRGSQIGDIVRRHG